MHDLYLIGNAHIDPVWLWRWQEGFSEIISTFRSALDRMKEFPDFKFTSACAVYYQWIEKMDPDMFREIQQRVKEGRWNIVGGWFLQPDCNIPDGESFARHALISQRYFKEKFGLTAKTGYNVDSFGHNASLPKILRKSGMENYVFMRPSPQEGDTKDTLFQWESDDGSKVCTYRLIDYNIGGTTDLPFFQNLKDKAKEEDIDCMVFYGVGNHGGGPTIKLIEQIKNLDIEGKIFSTPDEYFANADKSKLNTIRDELQHHARGCYSASSFVKQQNRKCENNLLAAEKLCVMAKELTGAEYPRKKLNKAWKNLLFNQFHDIMGGCSIKKAYEDAGYLYGEIMSITEQAINFAMQKISRSIDTLQGETLPCYKDNARATWHLWVHEVLGMPIVVFNPHTWKVKMPIQVNAIAQKMTDCDNNEIPFQIVRGDQTNGNFDKSHTVFTAEVEPMGYAVYRLFAEKASAKTFESELKASERALENSKIRVEFDPLTGDIGKLYDKVQNKYIIDKPCKAVMLDETDCDTWAHAKDKLGETVGMFTAPTFEVIEQGTIRAALRVTVRCSDSTIRRDYTIMPGSNEVRVTVKVDFHEKHRTLKFAFPMKAEQIISKIPYGTITRAADTGEEPCGSWFAVGDLCVANDSKYGYDTENGDIRLTVLRSAIYADHYGERDECCEYMEQGVHEFAYSVFPYESNAAAERRASELNYGLPFVFDSFHAGSLPEKLSGFSCDCDDVIVSAVKQSEDSEKNLLHFYEMNGKDTKVSFDLFGKKIDAAISHNEIKVSDETGKELDLIEWE